MRRVRPYKRTRREPGIGLLRLSALALGFACFSVAFALPYGLESRPIGLESRPIAKAYLDMPERAEGVMPARLSQTGAFRSIADLTPAAALIPYDINVSFWSDGAYKARWVAVP